MKMTSVINLFLDELNRKQPRLIRVVLLSATIKRILNEPLTLLSLEEVSRLEETDMLLEMHEWKPIFRKNGLQ